jgi:shikimate kinase
MEHRNVFLIGMPGAGKTTVGRALAKRLGLRFIDADREMVFRTGVEIATIFEIEGEAGFRVREAQLIAELVHLPNIVLATGGGAILDPESRRHLRENGTVVYLRADLSQLLQRTNRDNKRPLLQGGNAEEVLAKLLATRTPLYEQTAHVVAETDGDNLSLLLQHIVDALPQHSFQDKESTGAPAKK